MSLTGSYQQGFEVGLMRRSDGSIGKTIKIVELNTLEAPRDAQFYMDTIFNIHEEHRVKPVKRRKTKKK